MATMSKQPPEGKPPSFEERLEQLEAVVKKLEGNDLPLEESLKLFENGMSLSESCRQELESAETRVEMLLNKGGRTEVVPFDPEEGR